MIAAARGYGVSMGDLLMVAEDVAQGRLSLPWPTAVASGESYYLVWPKTRPGGERLRRLSDFLQSEVRAMACRRSSSLTDRCSARKQCVWVIPL
ncbi:LysR family transcriptional regulator [Pseudomonas fluorescens]|uniref:LysR family transcriptional regulator n=1 Tax=Pseudomonas fluorescens TaxID=294 RepID=A0A379I566_PSEFL|nr:LysR family transcriptional regulator [Pseudomonas fluorescens]